MSQVLKPSFILSHLLSSIPIKYLWQYRKDTALFTIPNLVNYIMFRQGIDNIVSPNRFTIHQLKGNSCIRLSSTVLVHNRSTDSTLEIYSQKHCLTLKATQKGLLAAQPGSCKSCKTALGSGRMIPRYAY